jgi:YidC/Oxa1 family membrane protein insertase
VVDLLARIFSPLSGLIGGTLDLFHSLGAPWWLSIVLLTVLVRALLFPLTLRQVKNMRAMQELRPEMDEIRSRYKKDRRKQQEAMAELYRERRVNPLAGFLPILIQIPVFLTLYRVVRGHEEAFPSFAHGGLLWFANLTQPDPYFILPVLSASLLLVASEISSKNVDPRQRQMMRFLPVAFTAFIARFPAGLFVYWVTSNAVTLAQNLIVYRYGPGKLLPHSLQKTQENVESPSSDGTGQAKQSTGPKKTRGKRRKKKKKRRS